MALSYEVCVYILYDHPAIISVTDWDSPYIDLALIVRKPHSHLVIFTTSAQKSHDASAMSLGVSL